MDPHEVAQEPTKRMIRIKISKALFEGETRRLNENLSRLIRKHEEITHSTVDGFLYRGEWMRKPDLPSGGGRSAKPMMHSSLNLEMAQHVNDKAIIDRDKTQIDQIIHKALTHCRTFQDIRDALPDLVIEFIDGVKTLPRIRQPFYFMNHIRDQKDWNRILPKIEMYYAGRLLY